MDTPKFTAELKAKWIEALRSGEYKQTSFKLRNDAGSYCCMGVLTKLCGATDDMLTNMELSYLKEFQILDLAVSNLLAEKNDHGRTFAEIAAYIEANIPAAAAQPTND